MSVPEASPVVWAAACVGIAASAEDLARRQVSNWIPMAALAAGVAFHGWDRGLAGVGASLAGAAAGFLVFLLLYLMGGMGGGDIKLMAGFGALLGAWGVLEAALWTSGVGGLMAVAWLAAGSLWDGWKWLRGAAGGEKKRLHIPYAPAITLGAWLAMVPKA